MQKSSKCGIRDLMVWTEFVSNMLGSYPARNEIRVEQLRLADNLNECKSVVIEIPVYMVQQSAEVKIRHEAIPPLASRGNNGTPPHTCDRIVHCIKNHNKPSVNDRKTREARYSAASLESPLGLSLKCRLPAQPEGQKTRSLVFFNAHLPFTTITSFPFLHVIVYRLLAPLRLMLTLLSYLAPLHTSLPPLPLSAQPQARHQAPQFDSLAMQHRSHALR